MSEQASDGRPGGATKTYTQTTPINGVQIKSYLIMSNTVKQFREKVISEFTEGTRVQWKVFNDENPFAVMSVEKVIMTNFDYAYRCRISYARDWLKEEPQEIFLTIEALIDQLHLYPNSNVFPCQEQPQELPDSQDQA